LYFAAQQTVAFSLFGCMGKALKLLASEVLNQIEILPFY
jgi:hypothetical protein